MQVENQTSVLLFQLLGFRKLDNLRIPFFFFFLLIYIMILTGNLIIISLVLSRQSLRLPMYIFLIHLSLCDILFTTNIIPFMLHIIWVDVGSITVTNCIIQFYVFGSSTSTESFLLTVMSYDRYLAICFPLHYVSIMQINRCHCLIFWSWLLGFMCTLIPGILVCKLQFCDLNVIDHFFCDLSPLLALSCSDYTDIVETKIIVSSLPIILFPFLFIVATYVAIFHSIMKIPSNTGKQKAFSTCSSHLTVVFTYYGTLIIVYMVPNKGHTSNINKVLSLMYIVVTPLFNPIIYSLRNKEIRSVLWKIISMSCQEKIY